MIDVHTHILPGLDDGAETLEESVRMAGIAAADGIEALVATPHADETFGQRQTLLDERLAGLREALAAAGLRLEVMAGCEAFVTPDLGARAAGGGLPGLNGSRYLLVEWPLLLYPTYADRALFDLRLKGLVPVLAHVERYRNVQADVNMLVGLIERGVLAQVTAGSLLGQFGSEIQRTAEIILEHDLAHVLASDAHSAAERPPVLACAAARVAQLVGAEAARALVVDVPRALVENRPLEVRPPRPYRRRLFWKLWR